MYKLVLPLVAVSLTACGGGSTTDPNSFITNVGSGSTVNNGVDTGGSTNPAIPTSISKSFSQSGGTFSVTPTATQMSLKRTNSSPAHQAEYELTVGNTTYTLRPAQGNSTNSSNNSFVDSSGNVELFLNENMPNASIANTQITSGSGKTEFFGVFGSSTPVATLTSLSSATYSGGGEISIDRADGNFDDAPGSTVNFSANFSAGTLQGNFRVSDPAGDTNGVIDIVGGVDLPFTGTIAGNAFAATVDYTNLVGATTGVTAINGQDIVGGFYGPNGENAVGVGLSGGTSAAANDTLVYTRIQATKQ